MLISRQHFNRPRRSDGVDEENQAFFRVQQLNLHKAHHVSGATLAPRASGGSKG